MIKAMIKKVIKPLKDIFSLFPLIIIFLITFGGVLFLLRNHLEEQFLGGFVGGILFLVIAQEIYPEIFLSKHLQK